MVALFSSRQHLKKALTIHALLESLAPIDENHRDLLVVPLTQLRVGIDVHLVPLKSGRVLDIRERLLNHVTQMTSFTRIHYHFMHFAIVIGLS